MSWTDRQRLMLQAMGLRVWAARPTVEEEASTADSAAKPSAPATAQATGQTRAAAAVNLQARPGPPTAASQPRPPPAASAPLTGLAAPDAAPLYKPSDASTAGALDWPELRATVAACTACSLCQTRRQTVFGSGSTQAHWMVVGEAPGHQEDLRGEPFVGPSGQLLDRMLAALQLSRDDDPALPAAKRVYIANALKCHPPRDRNPSADELSKCLPYLRRQVELLQPRLILALGGSAAKALLGSEEPVGQLRGRVHAFQGVPLIVSYHPAYLLRQPLEKAKAWQDLCLAQATMQKSAALRPSSRP